MAGPAPHALPACPPCLPVLQPAMPVSVFIESYFVRGSLHLLLWLAAASARRLLGCLPLADASPASLPSHPPARTLPPSRLPAHPPTRRATRDPSCGLQQGCWWASQPPSASPRWRPCATFRSRRGSAGTKSCRLQIVPAPAQLPLAVIGAPGCSRRPPCNIPDTPLLSSCVRSPPLYYCSLQFHFPTCQSWRSTAAAANAADSTATE